jgi:hypothetical protein
MISDLELLERVGLVVGTIEIPDRSGRSVGSIDYKRFYWWRDLDRQLATYNSVLRFCNAPVFPRALRMRVPAADPSARDVVQLADGRFARIDPEDFDRVIPHSWWAGGRGAPTASIGGKSVLLRRFLVGAPAGKLVINVNGDPLDCRKENLRRCSHRDKTAHRGKPRQNGRSKYYGSSQYKGVSWNTQTKRWRAQITHRRKMWFLGYFLEEESAARAYDTAAAHAWGPFARLNFPAPTE